MQKGVCLSCLFAIMWKSLVAKATTTALQQPCQSLAPRSLARVAPCACRRFATLSISDEHESVSLPSISSAPRIKSTNTTTTSTSNARNRNDASSRINKYKRRLVSPRNNSHDDDSSSVVEAATSSFSSLKRPMDGPRARREIQNIMQQLKNHETHNQSASTPSAASSQSQSLALQLQHRLVDLARQSKQHTWASDGALAQAALDAVKVSSTKAAGWQDPALLAELVCMTIQVWCHCGATDGLDRAEALLWELLNNPQQYLSPRLDLNTDIYNDAFSTTLAAITRQWHGRAQLPASVLSKMDALIDAYDALVRDPAVRLDMTAFGVNQILWVCLKSRRSTEALDWFQRLSFEKTAPVYRRPNLTTYNTVLQTLSLDGRPTEIEHILNQMVAAYGQGQDKNRNNRDNNQDSSAPPLVQPNHFSIMPWITAFERCGHDDDTTTHNNVVCAGQSAELAWRQVQSWHEAGLVDLSELRIPLVWNAVARAWVAQAQAVADDDEAASSSASKERKQRQMHCRRRLVELWHQAVNFDSAATIASNHHSHPASHRLARSVLSVLDPVNDWKDIQPILEQIDSLIEHTVAQENERETTNWIRLYENLHQSWCTTDGAQEPTNHLAKVITEHSNQSGET